MTLVSQTIECMRMTWSVQHSTDCDSGGQGWHQSPPCHRVPRAAAPGGSCCENSDGDHFPWKANICKSL